MRILQVREEAADRLEAELKNNTLKNQEVVLKFSPSITFYMESEPEAKIYTSTASDEPMRSLKLPASLDTAETAPVLN